jgi:transposase
MSGRKKKHRGPKTPPAQAVSHEEMAAILERTRAVLSPEEHAKLTGAIDTLAQVTAQLQTKDASIERLRRMIFGASTETSRNVLGTDTPAASPSAPPNTEPKPKVPGHGRNAAAAYTGAQQVAVMHPQLHSAQTCPGCTSGKVYPQSEPSKLVRITGMAPLMATVYACERLRCNLCGEVYTAPAPEGVGDEKYDATASSMVALLKYGTGLPFNRIETLQAAMGIPLPAATQWDLVHADAKKAAPAHEELINQAAQSRVVYNDDTTMKVLQLTKAQRAAALADDVKAERTGIFTSGIVATDDGRKIALFFTGVRHAGENLNAVLARRSTDLPPPIQMADGLSRNVPSDFDTLLGSCLAHARRKHVELAESFPEQVRFVLDTLREVYITDARARKDSLDPQQRLKLHQEESQPRMEALEKWMQTQFTERIIEPNSSLGSAILYMQKRWSQLTLFLRVAGAPLDSNIVERALKKAILHRKTAMFYRTLNGARVGDVFMSLIYSAELNGVPPFEYLVALQQHADQVRTNPGDWTPWNYQSALKQLNAAPDSSV